MQRRGALGTAALFAATHPSRTAALIVLECAADPGDRTELVGDEVVAAMVAMWGTGEFQHLLNPDMPWNEEIRATWARQERLAASPRTVAQMFPLVSEMNVRPILPTVRVPTLVVQHTDDPFITPTLGKDVADHIPGAKYVELPGRNMYHFVEPWRESFQEIAEFLTGHQADVADDRVLGCSPPCCSPTSWTRHVMPPISATATGMRCSTRTTPSSGRSSLAFGVAK